jgi:hypothetical protein
MNHLLNPSKEARITSPGNRLKNFLPALEFTIGLVTDPETLTTPERIPTATFSDIFVKFFALQISQDKIIFQFVLLDIESPKSKRGNKHIKNYFYTFKMQR